MTSPAFQFYVQDFLVGTLELTAEETGGYIRLLCHQWDKEGLPNDDKKLMQLAGVKSKTLQTIKEKFIVCEDGLLRNVRLEKEREKQVLWKQKSAEAGKKSGETRRTKMNQPSILVHQNSEPNTNSSSSISSSSSTSKYNYVNKKTRVGNQEFEISPGGLMWSRFEQGISEMMLGAFRTLQLDDVMAEIERQCPSGTIFTNDQHLLNKFKSVATKMLHTKKDKAPKNRQYDYSQYKRI